MGAPDSSGLTVSRGSAGDLSWEVAERAIDPRLAGLVTRVIGYAERSTRPVARRVTPHPALTVIISTGPPIEVNGTAYDSFVAGMHDTAGHIVSVGGQSGVELALTPAGAYRLFGVPPSEFTGLATALPVLDRLADRVAGSPDWATRFDLIGAALLRSAADGPAPDPAVAWAWREMHRHGGAVPVGALAAEIGWSRRHFTSRFRAGVGLPPKVAARVLRFGRASTLLARGVPAATVAFSCGYTDQSHLVREFRELAGCTPGAYVAELDAEQVTFVQDGGVGGGLASSA